MNAWLLYWKEYSDTNPYDPITDGWHTKQEDVFRQVQLGDSLWVVVNGGPKRLDDWLLFERIIVLNKKFKRAQRPCCFLGDPKKSEHFDLTNQPDLAPFLHKLQFATGMKIKAQGRLIGRSLQRIRRLSDPDTLLLEHYSRNLAQR